MSEDKAPGVFVIFLTILILSNLVAHVLRQYKKSLTEQTCRVIIQLNSYIKEILNLAATYTVGFIYYFTE